MTAYCFCGNLLILLYVSISLQNNDSVLEKYTPIKVYVLLVMALIFAIKVY